MNSSKFSKSSTLAVLNQVDKFMAAYFLPPAITLNLFNNVIVILFFVGTSKIRRSLPPTIYLNYLSKVLNDIANSIPIHLTHFLGKFCFFFLIYACYEYIYVVEINE